MKILIGYSSLTGNTKFLAEGIKEKLSKEHETFISPVKEIKDMEGYDLIIPAFWADKGTANRECRKFIEKIRDKKVFIIGTMGADPSSTHGDNVRERIKKLPDISNAYLGCFLARGKVSEKLIKRIKLLPLTKKIREEMYEASVNSTPTSSEDIENCYNALISKI